MSYIVYLNRKQRTQERALKGEGEDDEENQSEDDSQNSVNM